MNRLDQDRLLRDLFGGEELSTFRQASLDQGLALLRQRRRRRRLALRVCALACLPLALAAGAFVRQAILASTEHLRTVSSPALSGSSATARLAPIKFISDEQLLDLFPGRPLALVGRPGHQQLVFLDRESQSVEW